MRIGVSYSSKYTPDGGKQDTDKEILIGNLFHIHLHMDT